MMGVLTKSLKSNHIEYDKSWSKTIYCITPSCLITGVIAGYLGQYDTAIAEVAVFISSILHWSSPKPNWSLFRITDIIVVQASLAVHVYAIIDIWAIKALIFMGVSMICFGWSLYSNSYKHHVCGWIIACVSNLFLTYARYK